MIDALLEPSIANSVFGLLFAFSKDEALGSSDIQDFDSEIEQILPGIRLPPETRSSLSIIYLATLNSDEPFSSFAQNSAKSFSSERSIAMAILAILLRLSVTDGIVCREAARKFEIVANELSVEREEWLSFPEELQEIREVIAEISSPNSFRRHSKKISSLYTQLECQPECSDKELRESYRKLVKKYHPDSKLKFGKTQPSSEKFQSIQTAFEEIQKLRQIA